MSGGDDVKLHVRFIASVDKNCRGICLDDLIGKAEYVKQLEIALSVALHADVKVEGCTIQSEED